MRRWLKSKVLKRRLKLEVQVEVQEMAQVELEVGRMARVEVKESSTNVFSVFPVNYTYIYKTGGSLSRAAAGQDGV